MRAAELFAKFERDGWDCNPFEEMLRIAHESGEEVGELLRLGILGGKKSVTFLDAAISYVPEKNLLKLAQLANEALLKNQKNEIAQSVVAYLALQSVECLQEFLPSHSTKPPNWDAYYADWPWRGAADEEIERQMATVSCSKSRKERIRALNRIFQRRNPADIKAVLARLQSSETTEECLRYLEEVGLDGPERKLYSEAVFHIGFPKDFLASEEKPIWLKRDNHPSWCLVPSAGTHRFGGLAEGNCAICGDPLHNLLTLDPVPNGLGPAPSRRLQLATCISCLGWSASPIFFRHDDSGKPIPLNQEHAVPEFPRAPLEEMRVTLCPTPNRWKWQDWALANGRENLNRLGGHPTWIQGAEYPKCIVCDQLMPFLLQVDSDFSLADGGELLWGSGGICYLFWCPNCSVSASLWQCT